jgi:type II secretory pathway component GspD/PulD (secretin)
MAKKEDAFKEKKKKYGLSEYDEWRMSIEIIPLKYISVSAKQMNFLGQTIQVESLEDTLKGLIGSGYIQGSKFKNNFEDINKTSNKKLSQDELDIKSELTYLKIDSRTNSVIVKDFPDRIEEIRKIIEKLDVPAQLVEIEVTIASGTTGFTSQLGLALGGAKTIDGVQYGASTSSGVATNVNSLATGATSDLLQPSGALGLSGSMIYSGSKGIINAQLNVMENEGIGKVLSNPKMVTLDNRPATIHSGNTISLPVVTNDSRGLETVEAGIAINAIPHIIKKQNDDNKDIMLDISIESSSLGDTTGNQINKATNNINSSVIMKDGQTLILGGLFQYTKSDSKGGVPLLKDIPFLGFLFSTENELLNKSELVFFITPRVLTTDTIAKMKNQTQKYYADDLVKQKEIFKEKHQKDTQKDMDDRIKKILEAD